MSAPKSVNDVPCSRCRAQPGEGCVTPSGHPANEPHMPRVTRFWEKVADAAVADIAAERKES